MIGHRIVVTVLSIGRDQVRLGIEAPSDIEVHREEVYRSIQQANRQAAQTGGDVGQLAGIVPGGAGDAHRRVAADEPRPGRQPGAGPAGHETAERPEPTARGTATP